MLLPVGDIGNLPLNDAREASNLSSRTVRPVDTASEPREGVGGLDREDRRVEGREAWLRADTVACRVTRELDREARPREAEDRPNTVERPRKGVLSLAARDELLPDESGAPDEGNPSSRVFGSGDSSTDEEPGMIGGAVESRRSRLVTSLSCSRRRDTDASPEARFPEDEPRAGRDEWFRTSRPRPSGSSDAKVPSSKAASKSGASTT